MARPRSQKSQHAGVGGADTVHGIGHCGRPAARRNAIAIPVPPRGRMQSLGGDFALQGGRAHAAPSHPTSYAPCQPGKQIVPDVKVRLVQRRGYAAHVPRRHQAGGCKLAEQPRKPDMFDANPSRRRPRLLVKHASCPRPSAPHLCHVRMSLHSPCSTPEKSLPRSTTSSSRFMHAMRAAPRSGRSSIIARTSARIRSLPSACGERPDHSPAP